MLSPGRTDFMRFVLQSPLVWARRLKTVSNLSTFFYEMDDFQCLTDSETLEFLIDSDCGLTRLGNSELTFMAGRDVRHQRQNKRLRKLLFQCVADYNNTGPDHSNMLLALPLDLTIGRDYFNRAQLSAEGGVYRKDIWRKSPLFVTRDIVKKGMVYGATNAFRFRESVPSGGLENHINRYLTLLESRPSVYIGPKVDHQTARKLLPDVQILEIPSVNAFDLYDQLLTQADAIAGKEPTTQFLITAGLTGTVLSYSLNKAGLKALDVGQSIRHIGVLSS